MPHTFQHVLNDEDALFFYHYIVKTPAEIENRKPIHNLACKFGITIIFESGQYNKYDSTRDCIRIYDNVRGKNKIFFRHLRNAFAHQNIKISGDRCILLDCDVFKNKTITMTGDVKYNKFKTLLDEFFSDANLKPKSKNNESKT